MPAASRTSLIPLLSDFYKKIAQTAQLTDIHLFADGMDTTTDTPVQWTYPNGHQAEMSNFASQQNILRGLVALSQITGDASWKAKAADVSAYFLQHYTDPLSGLFHWGGHRFVNHHSGKIEGPASKECVHELKHHFPFYDFLHDIDPAKTETYLRSFWSAHVSDWQKLDLSRHGEYSAAAPTDLFQRYQPQDVVDPQKLPELPETKGLTFVNASTDLIYAASHYARYTGDQDAMKWAKHLYRQFVLARNPQTGMPVYQFSSPIQREPIPDDDSLTYSWFGDRAKRQFGQEFGAIAREANVLFRDSWPVIVDNPLAMLEIARQHQDPALAQDVVAGIKAYFLHAWDETSNQMIPMWNDGHDMTGYQFLRHGYYGPKGTELKRQPADPAYLLTLIRACQQVNDQELYALTARMFHRFGLGTLDPHSLAPLQIAASTPLCSAYLIFALLDLHQQIQEPKLLDLADCVANNLLQQYYHRGYFIPSASHRYCRFDDPTPFALLALEAAHDGCYQELPVHLSTGGYLHGEVNTPTGIKTVYDREFIYGVKID
jgi:pectate disaccharide-lyase